MQKIKRMRTADCVVGGFRYATRGKLVGSLLLGLYDDDGLLHHVGFWSGLDDDERKAIHRASSSRSSSRPDSPGARPAAPAAGAPSARPSGSRSRRSSSSRCSTTTSPAGRFRHGTRFLRWRPDKAPRQCTMDQLRK